MARLGKKQLTFWIEEDLARVFARLAEESRRSGSQLLRDWIIQAGVVRPSNQQFQVADKMKPGGWQYLGRKRREKRAPQPKKTSGE